MNSTNFDPADYLVSVVGLGLMGSSITTCLLISGHPVVAIAPVPADVQTGRDRVLNNLERSFREGITNQSPEALMKRLTISEEYTALKNCRLVIESTLEDLEIKKQVFGKIETNVADDAIITSNTSAIPISILQQFVKKPSRFLGLHWMEPSYTTRFLEIICGDKSDIKYAEWLYEISPIWSKEPTLVRKDVRGFITNRLMYAMYREAFNLVENGYATVEDVDRACRNNAGYWMTLVGVFRWMDLTGIPAYYNVMKDLFPTLSNQSEVPVMVKNIIESGGKGVANAHGFHEYTEEEARLWKETFEAFSFEIRKLALKYPADVVKKKLKERQKE